MKCLTGDKSKGGDGRIEHLDASDRAAILIDERRSCAVYEHCMPRSRLELPPHDILTSPARSRSPAVIKPNGVGCRSWAESARAVAGPNTGAPVIGCEREGRPGPVVKLFIASGGREVSLVADSV